MPLSKRDFTIKRNDTLPVFTVCIFDKGPTGEKRSFNMSGATGVTFSMVDDCGGYKIAKKTGTIVSATGGTIQYSWDAEDTNEAGVFEAEFQVNYSSGARISFPQHGFFNIEIYKDIIPD